MIRQKRVPVDDLPKAVQVDLVANLREEIPELEDESYEFIRANLFGLVKPPMVNLGMMPVKGLYSPSRSVSAMVVKKYQKMLRDGIEFDPVLVSQGKLVDGGHRVAAYFKEGRREMPVVDIESLLKMDWKKWLAGED